MPSQEATASLLVHAGGWVASEEEVRAVRTPNPTARHYPIAHGHFLDVLDRELDDRGIAIDTKRFALAREGRQMFGVYTVRSDSPDSDWSKAIGFRGSHDQSLRYAAAAGQNVLNCDNLSLHGEVEEGHKNTFNALARLPHRLGRMLDALGPLNDRIEADTDFWKRLYLIDAVAHSTIVQAAQRGIIPSREILKTAALYDEPYLDFQDGTAWKLFNCFTERAKTRSAPLHYQSTMKLTDLFREAFPAPDAN